tara:strand:- start:14507 stop:14902 length:396 start_codon:yes stop_codon:yes gene_type:complete
MLTNSKTEMGTNRSFGLVFFVFFLILSLLPVINGGSLNIWLFFTSLFFLILGVVNSKILTPFNKVWIKLGVYLGNIISPIIMGVIFFFVLTPIGLLLKVFGKDLLRTKYNDKKETYWIKREKTNNTMKRQF